MTINICEIDGCIEKTHTKGMCEVHYCRMLRGIDLYKPVNKRWTPEDIAILTDYYINTTSDVFSVESIAKILNRSEDSIILKAGRLGLTDKYREKNKKSKEKMKESQRKRSDNLTDEERVKIAQRAKDSIKLNGHPRGMLGKKHSDKTKQKLSKTTKAAHESRTDKERADLVLKSLKSRKKNGTLNPHRNGVTWKAGWRDINGYKKYYRSKWEANYARYLEWLRENGYIIKWEHEPDTFWFEGILRGVRSYLPDFKVYENNGDIVYHEVKGWMDSRSKTKLKRMKKYHPDVNLIVIMEKEYKEIERKVSRLITGWE